MAGAMLAAAGQLPSLLALAVLYAGIVVSDWALFALGRLAAWLPWARRRIGEDSLAHGRRLLSENITGALLTARLVPWLLFPVFCACGFLGVSFARFALVNAVIALVYASLLFWALLLFDSLLLSHLQGWGWAVAAAMILGLLLLKRHLARRPSGKPPVSRR